MVEWSAMLRRTEQCSKLAEIASASTLRSNIHFGWSHRSVRNPISCNGKSLKAFKWKTGQELDLIIPLKISVAAVSRRGCHDADRKLRVG